MREPRQKFSDTPGYTHLNLLYSQPMGNFEIKYENHLLIP